MGIRYYAYAFGAERTQQAIQDPRSIISDDPLADAWGLEPHASVSVTSFEQSVPRQDMLYLDKAWRSLQILTASHEVGAPARPAHRIFEGQVTMRELGWDAWVRTVLPEEVPAIRDDLNDLRAEQAKVSGEADGELEDESSYVNSYLQRACDFVEGLATSNRGMVYMIA